MQIAGKNIKCVLRLMLLTNGSTHSLLDEGNKPSLLNNGSALFFLNKRSTLSLLNKGRTLSLLIKVSHFPLLIKANSIFRKVFKGRPIVQYFMRRYRGDKLWQKDNDYYNSMDVKYI